MSRARNASRNVVSGVILHLFQVVVPFFMRTAMIYYLGMEYVGLNSLFTSIFQLLNITELGVASAMIFSMYKPIAEHDDKQVCCLMNLYKLYYRIIGSIILAFGLIIMPFIRYLINGDVPDNLNIYILYFISLLGTVSSYWMLAYRNSILIANQRIDVANKIRLQTMVIQYVMQLVSICMLKNYYAYIVIALLFQVINNLLIAYKSKKLFPQYLPIGMMPIENRKEINKRIRDLFISKIGNITIKASDSIIISGFLGLAWLGKYQNYNMIILSIISLFDILYNSIRPGIGNSLVSDTLKKNYCDLKKLSFLVNSIVTVCCCCFLVLFQPFIELWVGVENMLPFSVVVCLVVYFFIYEVQMIMNLYKDAAGIWKKDRFRPFFTAIVNVFLNIILIQRIGVYGVVLSTIISMIVVDVPWLFYNLFTSLFEPNYSKEYIFILLQYILAAMFSCTVVVIVCEFITLKNLVLMIILRGIVCVIVSILLNLMLFYRTKEFRESKKMIMTLIGKC